MKTKLMLVASVLALLLCGAAMIAYAQGPGPEAMGGPHGMGGPGHGMGFMARELTAWAVPATAWDLWLAS